jgi:hypothetical protein
MTRRILREGVVLLLVLSAAARPGAAQGLGAARSKD